jgi:hypothetical protein
MWVPVNTAWRVLVLRVKKRTANMVGKKVKFTPDESTKIQRYSSTLSLSWGLDGVVSQRHTPAGLSPGKKPGTHRTVSWMGPRPGVGVCGKTRPTGIPSPDRPARS